MGNHQLAIKDFNKSIEIDAELSEGYYRRGVSNLALHYYKNAIEDLLKAETCESCPIDERNAGIPCALGQCYHGKGELDQAIDYYLKAIDMDKNNTSFLMHIS